MKKILFLIQWYPSVLSANALCDQRIIAELVKNREYEIHCLSYRPFGVAKEEILDGVHVHRFRRSLWWNILIWAKQNRKRRITSCILFINKLVLHLFQLLTIPFFPYVEFLACKRYEHAARKQFIKTGFDLVISEYHGLDCLYAGRKLKEQYKDVPFMAILWDAFTGKQPMKYLPRSFFDKRMAWAEKKELSKADRIVAMESSREYHLAHSTRKRYFDRFVFLDIVGVVKPDISENQNDFIDKDKINVVYAGILNLPDRDPEYIINCFKHLKQCNKIKLLFFSTGNGIDKLNKLRNDFPGEISINGYVGRDLLSRIFDSADILLNFGNSNPFMVPSKIFEYMSYCKPIISVYGIDNDSSNDYLKRYPLSVCLDKRMDIESSVTMLQSFFSYASQKSITFDEVCSLFNKNTPASYVSLIEEMMGNV